MTNPKLPILKLAASFGEESQLLEVLRCADGRWIAAVKERRIPIGPNGEQSQISFVFSTDSGQSWETLSAALHWRSRIWNGLFASWPPEHLEEMSWRDNRLEIVTRDSWIPYEKPILPFRLDQESYWKAVFESRSNSWKLTRINYVDYEAPDFTAG